MAERAATGRGGLAGAGGGEPAEALLEGVRVLDFGRYIAGPFCAAMLGDLGAEVIRIERLAGSEDRYICPVMDSGEGALFLQVNRNKLSMTLNPVKPEGREVVRRLVASADVVVANMPVDGLREMGIDYQSLRAIRGDIILSSQTAFGDSGPYARRPGFDGVVQAMSGATYMSGKPHEPTKSYASWCDFSTAFVAAYGTVAALMYRLKTGRGQEVKANLLRTALNIFQFNNIEAYLLGLERSPSANRSQFGGPGDLFQTTDGWIQVQVVGQPLFVRWCELIGERHWQDDPRFANDHARSVNGSVLSERMQQWVGQFSTAEGLARLELANIPAGPLLSPLQVIGNEQVVQTHMLSWIDYPGLARPAPLVGGPVEFSEMDTGIRQRPPVLGEHTERVLAGLGYGMQEISDLRARRVV
jgi:crotonobetainyl-CoA:carnitine CoA-transferase CaiB-like acyl-CoA transferase